jgi:hypothetical protein
VAVGCRDCMLIAGQLSNLVIFVVHLVLICLFLCLLLHMDSRLDLLPVPAYGLGWIMQVFDPARWIRVYKKARISRWEDFVLTTLKPIACSPSLFFFLEVFFHLIERQITSGCHICNSLQFPYKEPCIYQVVCVC